MQRFGCVAMDEEHLGAVLRYVALNPVRARLVKRATDWAWSSIHAQLGKDDGMTDTGPVRKRYPDFGALIAAGEDEEMSCALRRAESIGRPLGSPEFIEHIERQSGRTLLRQKRGPKPCRDN